MFSEMVIVDLTLPFCLIAFQTSMVDANHSSVCQDMTQPLTHYFVATSHNTYLLDGQLTVKLY